jgi:hypothetical protein
MYCDNCQWQLVRLGQSSGRRNTYPPAWILGVGLHLLHFSFRLGSMRPTVCYDSWESLNIEDKGSSGIGWVRLCIKQVTWYLHAALSTRPASPASY